MNAPEMTFEESMIRARAEHVILDSFNQPGNDYQREHRCKCGAFVFAKNWDAHVLQAADHIRRGVEGTWDTFGGFTAKT